MRSLGYKWSQATVWSVEKGERPMRLTESIDIAQILGVDVLDMISTPSEALFRVALSKIADARERLENAAMEYEQYQFVLAAAAENATLSDAQQAQTRSWLSLSPTGVVEEVRIGEKGAGGKMNIEKDPVTGEILGRGPWFDELLRHWQTDRQGGARGEHKEA